MSSDLTNELTKAYAKEITEILQSDSISEEQCTDLRHLIERLLKILER